VQLKEQRVPTGTVPTHSGSDERFTQVGSLVLPIKIAMAVRGTKMPIIREFMHGVLEFHRAPNLVLKNSEGLLVLWTEPDDGAQSVANNRYEPNPVLVFSSCLLPLRWPTARKRV
jgi:hypothetical protein